MKLIYITLFLFAMASGCKQTLPDVSRPDTAVTPTTPTQKAGQTPQAGTIQSSDIPVDSQEWKSNPDKSNLQSEYQQILSKFSVTSQSMSVDFRLMDASSKMRFFESNATTAKIPMSINKVFSALSAHLNSGTSWSDIGSRFLHFSNNDNSQSAWSTAGRRGGIERAFATLGVTPPNNWVNVDGSGLSVENRISAEFMTDVLLAAMKQDWYPQFLESLPKSCARGTLLNPKNTKTGDRALSFCNKLSSGSSIVAKTGSAPLTGVKSLAGFALLNSGKTLVFTTIYNGKSSSGESIGVPLLETVIPAIMKAAENK